jgi:MFS family permease
LFKERSFAAATGFVLLSNMIMYTTLLAIPFFLKEVQGRNDASVGLVLGSMSIILTFLAPATGRYSDKRGRRLPAVLGGACMVGAATLLFIGIDDGVSLGYLAACLALLGTGIGLGTGPATAAAIEAAPHSQTGVASGMVSMTRYFGSIVGAGTLGSVLGDGATPSIEVFKVMFAAVAITSALTTLWATQIHRFAPERGTSARTAEQLS